MRFQDGCESVGQMAGTQEGHSQSELKLDVGTGPTLISRREVIIRAKDQSPLCLFQKMGSVGDKDMSLHLKDRYQPSAFMSQRVWETLAEPARVGC